ncbi:MAG: TonB-dependent receptor [Thermodesulfovibrio sp.]|nr:TonB-dependent receptor [Thermodesulfovibrio sp.]
MFLHLFIVALALCLSPPAQAQTVSTQEEEQALLQVYGSEKMVSIATGGQQDLRRAPAVATVITAEDIANMGASNLDEVMVSVPGVHVSRSAISYLSSYTIRGIYGNPTNPQVLMLQNGIPTNSLYRGDRGQSMGAPPLENVSRIEIIRGPGSALYGADAFSGVINIITKTAADIPGTEAGVRGGSFNTRDAWVQHGGRLGGIDVAAYLRAGSSDGHKEIIRADAATRLNNIMGTNPPSSLAPGSVNTGYKAVDVGLDLGYDNWRLRTGYKLRNDVGTGAGVSYALDPVGKEKTRHFNADLSWSDPKFSQNWGLGFTVSYLQHIEDMTNYQLFPPNTRFPNSIVTDPAVAALLGVPVGTSVSGQFSAAGMIGSPGRWERQTRLSGYATYSGFVDHSLRFGLGHEDLNMYKIRTVKNFWLSSNGTPVPTGAVIDYSSIQQHQLTHRRFNDYVFAQDEWKFARDWRLTAGLRFDNYSDFGSTTNPRLALVWDATLDLTAKLLYGQAFRAPALNEQYGVNPSAMGNPNLKPESIRTLEAAFFWRADKSTQLNLSLFYYSMKDVIAAVTNANPTTGATFQNTGKRHGSGVELEAVWDAGRTLRLTGNYSWQQSIDDATNTDAGYAPHHHVYARGDWRFADNWLLSPQVNWVADRSRAAGDTRPKVADYTTVDITARTIRSKNRWSISASIFNLFNTSVFEPSLYVARPSTRPDIQTSAIPYDLPLAGRSFYAEIRYDF